MTVSELPTPDRAKRMAEVRAWDIGDRLDSLIEHIEAVPQLLAEAWYAKDWQLLGHDSWTAYCEERFGTRLVRLAPDVRQRVHRVMLDASRQVDPQGRGMTVRDLGAATGSGVGTVHRDTRSPDVPDGTGDDTADLLTADEVAQLERELGRDADQPRRQEELDRIARAARQEPTCDPFNHFEALASALLRFIQEHENQASWAAKPQYIRAIKTRLKRAARIMEEYQ